MEVERFAPYLGFFSVAIIGAFAVLLSNAVGEAHVAQERGPVSPSTVLVVPSYTLPTLSLPTLAVASATPTLVPPPQAALQPRQSPTPLLVMAPPPRVFAQATDTPPLPLRVSGDTALDSAAVALRRALINIICYAPINGALHSISGSGIVIDPKGFILTNAHIGQYFLLVNRGVSCTIRTGSPAVGVYTAELAYISPEWVQANPDLLTKTLPRGTGQYDFALLGVTGNVLGKPLSAPLSFVSLATDAPPTGAAVAIAAYGAQSLGYQELQDSLYPTVVFTTVKDVFTFAVESVDIVSLGGSLAAQEGSSGGGVINNRSELVATLTTSTISGDWNERTLNAITSTYIRAQYASETGETLSSLLIKTPTAAISTFAPKASILEAVITAHLP